ncbi:MAG: Minf_1886 family protein, partial [Pirellulaceae bacterium]
MPRLMSDEIHPLVKLLCEDRRYKLEAYQFVRAGLAYAQEGLGLGQEPEADVEKHPSGRPLRHVTGQDLCHGLREFAHEQFGLLARHVLTNWGIRTTSDIGEIVYNL